MAMSGKAEPNNHNPTLYIYWVILCCLEKYKRDWNEAWFI